MESGIESRAQKLTEEEQRKSIEKRATQRSKQKRKKQGS